MGGSYRSSGWLTAFLGIASSLALLGCDGGGSDGSQGPAGPAGPPGPPGGPGSGSVVIGPLEPLPGVVATVVGVSDSTGGSLAVGDFVTLRFTAKTDAGDPLDVAALGGGQIYLSGPTDNYQRVLLPKSDVATHSVYEGNGVWAYTFADPIPALYPAPVNDTASFGAVDGELQGTPLVDGTYTVGLQMYWYYDVDGVALRDAGSVVKDLLFGAATTISHREVVANSNCNTCHTELRAHGGSRVDVQLCVLCHTAGSEDKNVGTVLGGTPGVTVDFAVMIHQIHNAKHLPSVLGVGTLASGLRDYAAPAIPLQYVGYQNSIIDLSTVGWPMMPSAYAAYIFDTTGTIYQRADGNGPMPKDAGYGALLAAQKHKEDQIRTGAVQCAACHGDPDGSGTATAPAQGDLFKLEPSRRACGSCHDDVDWTKPYVANGQTMPGNLSDATCVNCHTPTAAGSLPNVESHLHPYSNPALNTGINLHVLGVSGGTAAGRHQLGDPITVQFDVKNDAGADIPLHQTARGQALVTGPTTNPQALSANVNLFDSSFRKSSPFTGAGTITGLTIGATASDRVYAVVFTAANTFDVTTFDRATDTFASPLTGQVVPPAGSLPVALTGISFTVNDTGTDFAAGDRFYMEVIPPASSYTKNIPFDVALENLGPVPSVLPAALTVANTPLIWGRQVVMESIQTGSIGSLLTSMPLFGRTATVDTSTLTLARRDYVILDYGTTIEEIVRIGRIQTTDDATGADLGANDRLHFATTTRFAHAAGATIQEITLTNRREGVDYVIPAPNAGQIQLLPAVGAWTSLANRVVVSYRTDLRFGRKRYFTDTLQDAALDAPADTDDIDQSWGDWKGLPYLHGTYTVGFWINRDFTTSGNIPTLPNGESTGYRMISPPATFDFLFGAGAGALAPRAIIADAESCNACHGDVVAHGNGRRGLETCLMCHAVPGFEDGPRFTIGSGTNPDFDLYAPSFVPASPGVTMDFRQLLHKVHMGKELAMASQYKVVGVFLGVPYGVTYEEAGFPVFIGGAAACAKCHGSNPGWKEPAARVHPLATKPTQVWRSVCNSCHDSPAATAHITTQTTAGGAESCDMCHGPGKAEDVEKVHFKR